VSNFQIYSNATVQLDGQLLTEEATVSIDKKSGVNPVMTQHWGFAGVSQGAQVSEVAIECAVPTTNFDFDVDAYIKSTQVVEVTIMMANQKTVCQGFITDCTYSHSVNKEAQMHIKIMCNFQAFESL
jgi:hypothetical protein